MVRVIKTRDLGEDVLLLCDQDLDGPDYRVLPGPWPNETPSEKEDPYYILCRKALARRRRRLREQEAACLSVEDLDSELYLPLPAKALVLGRPIR